MKDQVVFLKGTLNVFRVVLSLLVHLAGSDEDWRKQRFSLTDFLARQLRKDCFINPIFAIAGITLEVFRIDWLHAVDLGVGADFLGNLFWMIAEKSLHQTKRHESI